jgi:hypothetical protein
MEGYDELLTVEAELKEHLTADTTKCCGTGTCS